MNSWWINGYFCLQFLLVGRCVHKHIHHLQHTKSYYGKVVLEIDEVKDGDLKGAENATNEVCFIEIYAEILQLLHKNGRL